MGDATGEGGLHFSVFLQTDRIRIRSGLRVLRQKILVNGCGGGRRCIRRVLLNASLQVLRVRTTKITKTTLNF